MGRLTTSTGYFQALAVAVGVLLGVSAGHAQESADSPAAAAPLPLIYDNAALNTRSVDIPVTERLQLQLLTPADLAGQGSGYAATSGTWRPLDSITLRAGYGVSPAAGGELAGCTGDGCLVAAQATPIETYRLGASWQFASALNLNVDYLARQSENPGVANAPWLSTSHSALNLGNSEAIDVSLVCDINAGNWGDLEVGLQLSRLVNTDYDLRGPADDNVPVNAAALGLGWQKGAFRTDLTSRYLDILDDGAQEAGWTSFDINFAWRMPWNASVSVGARNVLNNPAPPVNNLSDAEVENFFGRVPYVRYQQDL